MFVIVSVRLFATLREAAGSDSVELELEQGSTVADAMTELGGHGRLGELLGRLPVRMAVNREYAAAGTVLGPGDEIALIPPISGGAGPHATVTEVPIAPESVTALVSDASAGAIVTFQGVTREVSSLDYEAYREMAERKMAGILEDCVSRHGLAAAAAEHRVGPVPLGEPGVVVAVSAPHRAEAFAGASEAIDRIKAEAPIWKREVEAGGVSRWVEGRAADAGPGAGVPSPAGDPGP